MNRPDFDIILVGGGLANGLIAWRLQQQRPGLRVLLIEQATQIAGNHTWSFHHHDLTPEQHHWIAPLISHHWPHYDVRFEAWTRRLDSGYYSISADHFAQQVSQLEGLQCFLQAHVTQVQPNEVRLDDGMVLHARAVIDGRGFSTDSALKTGYQLFVGQEWTLQQAHRLTGPILMDATVAQQGGYRFVYTLPLSSHRLLIEDTHYRDGGMLDTDQAKRNIQTYATAQGWQLASLEREEQGALPITLDGDFEAFWHARREQACSGLQAGLFHATTGYSLPQAVALADLIALTQPEATAMYAAIHQFARQHWRRQRFFRALNRMLFLAAPADQRWQVMARFYRLNAPLIQRFYAGELTFRDKVRLLAGKPPVPVLAAAQALFKPDYPQGVR
ncbi:lycopene beta-cyclase CrtY [Candidatus Pantoea multigeneris]|uniref:Lycopene beta-cyclase CrtY n=1 Tax=Candidatus Pantoea multigeneris TaxID=2608357 RepID=A0ABX0RJJ3_9GAMM|nr:lycopene beta-cyclase CrtY [Pantoea multigeneris]NIF23799.1 lycopene beta-cyclase CrtY [Pantoea multigeneris]